jgi:hypothetical protein
MEVTSRAYCRSIRADGTGSSALQGAQKNASSHKRRDGNQREEASGVRIRIGLNDLLKCAKRGLRGLALWIFFETSVGIVRENTTQMSQLVKTMLRVGLGALAVLMVPLVASQVVEGWNWNAGSFVFVYVLFFGTGMVYAVIARKMAAWSYKAGVGVALAAGFALGWSNMAHVADSENPANLVYYSVLAVGGRWGLADTARGARVGSRVVRDGGDACADGRDAAFGRAALPCTEYGHRAWCLRGVVHRLRSTVPASEFGEIEVRPGPITNRPAGSSRARFGLLYLNN